MACVSASPHRLRGHVLPAGAALLLLGCSLVLLAGCGSGHGSSGKTIVVNSAADTASPAVGEVTLRSAMAAASSGDTIAFDKALNGATITLTIVGQDHSVLLGETYSGMTFAGYAERDYGRSALYARKSLAIDASSLSEGITVRWGGDASTPARVLAIYGDLTMRNVTISGGASVAEAITGGTQPYTLARGGGLAVWGTATLRRCTIWGNRCVGDTTASRDRGTYGGGIYANGLNLEDCAVSGNTATGYGAAGGGIYSVGGADHTTGLGNDAKLTRCAVSGNCVTAQHAYGGGIFTLSGGPSNLATMYLANCTIARNLVQDNPDIANAGQFYFRGGGVYMGGGSLSVVSCTIVENQVNGEATSFSGKPNAGGGGVAATIGNAHTVETVWLRHSIVVGNTLNGAAGDWFAGSLLVFQSYGYNLIGSLDFSQILVPVPDWMDLNRKHYPKVGDADGVTLAQAVDAAGAQRSAVATSAGTDAGQPAVLWYPPAGQALNRIPGASYTVSTVTAGYTGFGLATDDFLNRAILQVRSQYGATVGSDFGSSLGDLTGVTWYGPRVTWPSDAKNAAWIAAWRSIDTEIAGRLGTAGLNDDFWGSFTTGSLGSGVSITVERDSSRVRLAGTDQLGSARHAPGDIGAIDQ